MIAVLLAKYSHCLFLTCASTSWVMAERAAKKPKLSQEEEDKMKLKFICEAMRKEYPFDSKATVPDDLTAAIKWRQCRTDFEVVCVAFWYAWSAISAFCFMQGGGGA